MDKKEGSINEDLVIGLFVQFIFHGHLNTYVYGHILKLCVNGLWLS